MIVPDSNLPGRLFPVRFRMIAQAAVCASLGAAPAMAQVSIVDVPGHCNPWLAGMPDGSTASGGDSAPAQSPAPVPFAIRPGAHITFTSTSGMAGYSASVSCPPEGCPYQFCKGAENGVAGVCWSTASCLIGVFLDDSRPDLSPTPPDLNFGTPESLEFSTLSPDLKQVFFIGDGEDSNGRAQTFIAPPGATRLFLGTSDGSGWYDNSGSFTATVTQTGGASPCYANCDGSSIQPILNVNDFICFQTKYAQNDTYANCDGSTIPPVLNVNDFICFQTKYAQGCP